VDITPACEVMASSCNRSTRRRSALHGVSGGGNSVWMSDGQPPYEHWLRLTLPEGLQLQRLTFFAKNFRWESPSRMRVWAGANTFRSSMTRLADVELVEDRDYTVTLVSEVLPPHIA